MSEHPNIFCTSTMQKLAKKLLSVNSSLRSGPLLVEEDWF